jgi:putative transposase
MRKCYLYPTDLTDKQWALLQSILPKAKKRGRPPTDRRLILSGLLYLVRAGCAWRLLPREFGPWETVYGCFRSWRRQGLWWQIHETLRRIVRREAGKRSQPTAAILDSQSVRSADHAGPRGYDAGKKVKGRKRHILVDTLGLLLWVCVTPADVSEKAGARSFLSQALQWFGYVRCIWADQGYIGAGFAAWVAAHRATGTLRLEIVSRLQQQIGFKVLAKRWIVERTFGWFMKHRRLVRDYEIRLENAEAMLHLAMIGVMLRRLR